MLCCRLHAKAVKKQEKRLHALAVEHDAVRQEVLIKAAELLDLQAQLKEADARQQLQQDAAHEQVGSQVLAEIACMVSLNCWMCACVCKCWDLHL